MCVGPNEQLAHCRQERGVVGSCRELYRMFCVTKEMLKRTRYCSH